MRGSVVFRDLCMGFGFVWLYNPVSMIGPVRISVWGLDFFGISVWGMDFWPKPCVDYKILGDSPHFNSNPGGSGAETLCRL